SRRGRNRLVLYLFQRRPAAPGRRLSQLYYPANPGRNLPEVRPAEHLQIRLHRGPGRLRARLHPGLAPRPGAEGAPERPGLGALRAEYGRSHPHYGYLADNLQRERGGNYQLAAHALGTRPLADPVSPGPGTYSERGHLRRALVI